MLLSQLGTYRYQAKYGAAGAPGQHASQDNPRFFPETQHTVGGQFRAYWESHGGLAQQGYPISDEYRKPVTSTRARVTRCSISSARSLSCIQRTPGRPMKCYSPNWGRCTTGRNTISLRHFTGHWSGGAKPAGRLIKALFRRGGQRRPTIGRRRRTQGFTKARSRRPVSEAAQRIAWKGLKKRRSSGQTLPDVAPSNVCRQ